MEIRNCLIRDGVIFPSLNCLGVSSDLRVLRYFHDTINATNMYNRKYSIIQHVKFGKKAFFEILVPFTFK